MIVRRVYYGTTSVLSMEATTSGRRSHRRCSGTTTPTAPSTRLYGGSGACRITAAKCVRHAQGHLCPRDVPGGGLPSWLRKATGWRLWVHAPLPVPPSSGQNNNHPFNNSCKLSSLETSYNIPVALWPHGLFNKPPNHDPHREYFDIVDRNRTYD
jgi:hypothetical protein